MRFKYINKGNKFYYLDTKTDYGTKAIPNIFNLKSVDFDGYQVDEPIRPSNSTRKFNLIMKILTYLAIVSFPIIFIMKDTKNIDSLIIQIQVISATILLILINIIRYKKDNIDEHLIVSKSKKKVNIRVKYVDNNIRLGLLVVFIGLILTTLVSLGVSGIYWNNISAKYLQVILGPISLVFSVFFYLHAFYYLKDLEYNLVKKKINK